jgi:two-component system chemotaxis sensor kinase CheA
MIRNSADHGVESPEKRVASGKPSTGVIKLTCSVSGENVMIEQEDDGAGIDPQRIRSKLVEKNLMTEDEVKRMSDSAVIQMIFASGFSTAAQVTDVSGRGVGMDMVKTSVEKIGGKVTVESVLGKGTKFILQLPIPKSVLIINSLFVEASGETYAIPQSNVIRLVQVDSSNKHEVLKSIQGGEVLSFEGHLVPVVRLEHVLNLPVTGGSERFTIVVVKSKNDFFGILVNSISDIEDTVVKKLKPKISGPCAFAGATFLGDGRVGLVLDIEGLAEVAHVAGAKRALSVDDRQQSAQDAESADYLVFHLGGDEHYAVPLQGVFRLEEFAKKNVFVSGAEMTTIYRDRVMPLLDLRALLGGESTEQEGYYVIVIARKEGYVGFIIKHIEDIIRISAKPDLLVSHSPGSLGVLTLKDRVITLLSPDLLLETVVRGKEEVLEEPAELLERAA